MMPIMPVLANGGTYITVKARDVVNMAHNAIAKIENAEVRREFVRKVGIERIATACGSICLDKQGDYELLSINLGGSTGECSYLKMLNPSIGVWHLEAVPPEVDTVAKALAWRNQSDLAPIQLT